MKILKKYIPACLRQIMYKMSPHYMMSVFYNFKFFWKFAFDEDLMENEFYVLHVLNSYIKSKLRNEIDRLEYIGFTINEDEIQNLKNMSDLINKCMNHEYEEEILEKVFYPIYGHYSMDENLEFHFSNINDNNIQDRKKALSVMREMREKGELNRQEDFKRFFELFSSYFSRLM